MEPRHKQPSGAQSAVLHSSEDAEFKSFSLADTWDINTQRKLHGVKLRVSQSCGAAERLGSRFWSAGAFDVNITQLIRRTFDVWLWNQKERADLLSAGNPTSGSASAFRRGCGSKAHFHHIQEKFKKE